MNEQTSLFKPGNCYENTILDEGRKKELELGFLYISVCLALRMNRLILLTEPGF